jgi:hypothetical protein
MPDPYATDLPLTQRQIAILLHLLDEAADEVEAARWSNVSGCQACRDMDRRFADERHAELMATHRVLQEALNSGDAGAHDATSAEAGQADG